MLRRFAAAVLLAVLAMPAAALAADPVATPPTAPLPGGAWEIVAIETAGGALKVGGKLAVGAELSASVGCNSMSAPVVSFDGTTLEIGPVATTEIGCPADLAAAEGMLGTVLSAGSLTFDGATFSSATGSIEVDGGTVPPDPSAVPPDTIDPSICASILGPDWIGSGAGSGSGSGGGSAGSSSGSTGSGTAPSGAGGGGSSVDGGGTTVDGGAPDAGSTNAGGPVTGGVDPVPPTAATGVDDPGTVAEPPSAIESAIPAGSPEAGPAASAPPIGPAPLPAATPSGSLTPEEACRALQATILSGDGGTAGSGAAVDQPAPAVAGDLETGKSAETATDAAQPAATAIWAGAILLLVLAVAGLGLVIRAGRRRAPLGAGSAPGPEGGTD